jgi:hypothetical protein
VGTAGIPEEIDVSDDSFSKYKVFCRIDAVNRTDDILKLRGTAFQDFGRTIHMLEETMGIYVGSSVMKPNYFNPDGPFPG